MDRLEGAEDLAQGHARGHLLSAQVRAQGTSTHPLQDSRPGEQLQGPRVDGAVLSDLQAQRVEAERLDLPAKLQ